MIIAREREREREREGGCNSGAPARSLRRCCLTLIFEIVSRVRIRDFNGAEDISICVGLKFIRGN